MERDSPVLRGLLVRFRSLKMLFLDQLSWYLLVRAGHEFPKRGMARVGLGTSDVHYNGLNFCRLFAHLREQLVYQLPVKEHYLNTEPPKGSGRYIVL